MSAKEYKDRFSRNTELYLRFRPNYPEDLIEFVVSICGKKNVAWDCGTGNGQVAVQLARYFSQVYATDSSETQLAQAPLRSNIQYSQTFAEHTDFPDFSFDLITVAQAIHWFDHKKFNSEAKRLLKPDGILAIWGYALLRINPEIDEIIDHFYTQIIGPFWDEERKHIDKFYQSIPLPFQEIPVKRAFSMQFDWTLSHLEGYLNTWSAVKNYRKFYGDKNPVDLLIEKIKEHWQEEQKQVTFPIFLRMQHKIN